MAGAVDMIAVVLLRQR